MEGRHTKLLDNKICDFLNVVHSGKPNYITPLSDAIGKLNDVLNVSHVSVMGADKNQKSYVIFKKNNAEAYGQPDWEYVEHFSGDREIKVQYWKDDGDEWNDDDYTNLVSLSHFIILYTGGLNNSGSLVSGKEERKAEEKIIASFNEAIQNEDFVVYYQPKVDLSQSKLVGAEALVRWYSDGKIIPPNDFIPVFERNGLVCQLDFYVLEKVCKDIRKWLDEGYEVVKTSVNFSRVHLSDHYFTKRIIDMLEKYDIPSRYIEIEFTETGDTEAYAMLSFALEELKGYGIATAMDDFGTGYSSLNLLTDLSFDILKIDKSFLDEGKMSKRDRIVINNIIKMVKDLNIEVIMEGVETVEQVHFLKEADCSMAQGYIFDKPLPLEQFEYRLKEKMYKVSA